MSRQSFKMNLSSGETVVLGPSSYDKRKMVDIASLSIEGSPFMVYICNTEDPTSLDGLNALKDFVKVFKNFSYEELVVVLQVLAHEGTEFYGTPSVVAISYLNNSLNQLEKFLGKMMIVDFNTRSRQRDIRQISRNERNVLRREDELIDAGRYFFKDFAESLARRSGWLKEEIRFQDILEVVSVLHDANNNNVNVYENFEYYYTSSDEKRIQEVFQEKNSVVHETIDFILALNMKSIGDSFDKNIKVRELVQNYNKYDVVFNDIPEMYGTFTQIYGKMTNSAYGKTVREYLMDMNYRDFILATGIYANGSQEKMHVSKYTGVDTKIDANFVKTSKYVAGSDVKICVEKEFVGTLHDFSMKNSFSEYEHESIVRAMKNEQLSLTETSVLNHLFVHVVDEKIDAENVVEFIAKFSKTNKWLRDDVTKYKMAQMNSVNIGKFMQLLRHVEEDKKKISAKIFDELIEDVDRYSSLPLSWWWTILSSRTKS